MNCPIGKQKFSAVSNPRPDFRDGDVILNLSHREISKINLRLRLAWTTRNWQKHWKMAGADTDDQEITHILNKKDSRDTKRLLLGLALYRYISKIAHILKILY